MGFEDSTVIRNVLESAIAKGKCVINQGEVATYIPDLANAPQDILGISMKIPGLDMVEVGDSDYKFTLQSISKIFSLALAIEDNTAEAVFQRVGMEPTADPFNSIIRLERPDSPKPLNPLINAGAISVVDLIKGKDITEKFDRILHLIRNLCDNDRIDIDERVLDSERKTGNRNRSLTYFLKDLGLLTGNVEEVLDLYFRQCAIEVTTSDLATAGEYFGSSGKEQDSTGSTLSNQTLKILRTLMLMCGMYDGSGGYAVKTGIPAKSGVSGGILAVVPHQGIGLGVIGPSLDDRGNSIGGQTALEILSSTLKLHIFY